VQLYAVVCRADGAADRFDSKAAIERAARAFPQLVGGATTSGRSGDGRLFFAAFAHPRVLSGGRRYADRRGDVVTLLDGLPVDREGRFAAHDAASLHDHWEAGPNSLEGIFSALRIDLGGATVDCLLDPVGMAKVYLARLDGGWVVSNSVEAVRSISGRGAPDPLGVSALLNLGWPASRTLIDGIEPLAGGRLHRLGVDSREQQPYLTAAMVAPSNNRRRVAGADSLAESLRRTTAAAVDAVGAVSCPLTAGRDTRALFALALSLGRTEIDYYTSGAAGEPDVEFARALAAHAGVEHRVVTPEVPSDQSRWLEATTRFCAQTDGMASIYGISDHVDHGQGPATLGLKLWGAGGEVARAGNIGMLIPIASQVPGPRSSWQAQRRTLDTKTSSLGGVVQAEAVQATRDYLRDFTELRRAEGWRPNEVLEAYYAFERVPNWASTGVRRVSGATDLFSPYISRDFYEYAFGLSSGERYVEAAHHRLLSTLSPDLRDLPFEKPWKPQRPRLAPLLALAGGAGAARERLRRKLAGGRASAASRSADPPDFGRDWFERGIDSHRELCASVPGSPLWGYVDRARLDAVLAAPAETRRPHVEGLCAVLTAFWYFHGR
jgi:hypothetical protein